MRLKIRVATIAPSVRVVMVLRRNSLASGVSSIRYCSSIPLPLEEMVVGKSCPSTLVVPPWDTREHQPLRGSAMAPKWHPNGVRGSG